MNRPIALGTAVLASVATLLVLSPDRRHRIRAGVRRRMTQRMEHMLAGLPEESPPKLIMTILPQLHKQNEEIIAMLRELNALLRDQQAKKH
jgi:tRNA/tmRNA/rRNA uracil-C5-methylase (TrmA/RlmC/RlmD family)